VFELPEVVTLAAQVRERLVGRTVVRGTLGARPHKFVSSNRTPDEFASLVAGLTIAGARALAKWLFIDLEPGYVLAFGECGGRLRLHESGSPVDRDVHLLLELDDGSALSMTTAMWGAMELHERGAELDRPGARGLRPTPIDAGFTIDHLVSLVAEQASQGRTAKGLLTQESLVPGLGNALAQDILFEAGLHPRRALTSLDRTQVEALHGVIVRTVRDAIDGGGRDDEVDLFGNPGRYRRRMDRRAVGRPCPRCDTAVVKLQYLGGACHICPGCQR
jgi:formamidopyrimidine-DNA glycosylase